MYSQNKNIIDMDR